MRLLVPRPLLSRPRAHATSHRGITMMADNDDNLRPSDPIAIVIDVVIRTVSVWFLPLIVLAGLSLAAAGGQTFPIRVGAPKDPLSFPVPAQQKQQQQVSGLISGRSPFLLASMARDPVLEDLRDMSSPARTLTLPRSEQRREQELQTLEDERLDRCRSASPFTFDQVSHGTHPLQ